jgi:cobalamin biosynthetic protein CobC
MDSRETVAEGRRALRYHGGNINAARAVFPEAPEPWIDLSTGINPVPYPVGVVAPSAWTRLPEPTECAVLEAAAGAAYGAKPSTGIVAAPGTQSLIQWLPRLWPAQRVGVLGFTYGEHETCWQAAGADVTSVTELADLARLDIGVVVNPNNPDGRIVPPNQLAEIAGVLDRRGGRLIVDEAFMDVSGRQSSLVPCLPAAGAVVLRSFGKAYGLAGLRLGFAVARPEDCALLRSAMGPWPVSGPAIAIGRRALEDATWLAETIARLDVEAARLDRLLQSAGCGIAGGTRLFRLAELPGAEGLFERLCQAGILCRPFRSKSDWLRFGIPHSPEQWRRLEAALWRGLAGC